MGLKIRPATNKDVVGVYKVFLNLLKVEDESLKDVANNLMNLRKRKKNFEVEAKKELIREFKEKKSLYLVLVNNKKIIGYCYGSYEKPKDPFFDRPVIGYLNSLVIDKKFQNKGFASKLYQEMEKWFKKNKCEYIRLEVFFKNSAVNIYEKWGYKTAISKMVKKL